MRTHPYQDKILRQLQQVAVVQAAYEKSPQSTPLMDLLDQAETKAEARGPAIHRVWRAAYEEARLGENIEPAIQAANRAIEKMVVSEGKPTKIAP